MKNFILWHAFPDYPFLLLLKTNSSYANRAVSSMAIIIALFYWQPINAQLDGRLRLIQDKQTEK